MYTHTGDSIVSEISCISSPPPFPFSLAFCPISFPLYPNMDCLVPTKHMSYSPTTPTTTTISPLPEEDRDDWPLDDSHFVVKTWSMHVSLVGVKGWW